MIRKKALLAFLTSSTLFLTGCNSCDDPLVQSYDGSCNNVFFTTWGKVGNFFEPGIEGSEYAEDGISPKQTINERYISNTLMANRTGVTQLSDSGLSHNVLWMGQFVTHDFSRIDTDFSHPFYTSTVPEVLALTGQWAALPDGPQRNALIQQAIDLINQNQAPGVLIEDVDNDELANMTKSVNPLLPYTGHIPYPVLLLPDSIYELNDAGEKRVKNFINSWLDLSNLYGDSEEVNTSLRTGSDGKLKTIDLEVTTHYRPLDPFTVTLHDVLPTSNMVAHEPSVDPVRPFNPAEEFSSGDLRASENYNLTAFHMAFHRYHNILADQIAEKDKRYIRRLSDEQADEYIFQKTRRALIAIYQHILYDEYLPALLGSQFDELIGEYDGYKPWVKPDTNPTMINAAFRYAHSSVPQDFIIFNENGENNVPADLRDTIYVNQFGQTTVPGLGQTGPRAPFTIVNHVAVHGGFDDIIRSMAVTATSEIDLVYEDSVRNVIAAQSLIAAGIDLASIDIFRAREHGVPNYDRLRDVYGDGSVYGDAECPVNDTAAPDAFGCFLKITSNYATAGALLQVYGKVSEIDGIVGLLAEDHVEGSPLPRTMAAIIADEFKRKRSADRFWYERILKRKQRRWVESISMGDIFAATACGIGQPNCSVTLEELDPTGNGVFKVPENYAQTEFELGACMYTDPTPFGNLRQCDEPVNRQACARKHEGVFLGNGQPYVSNVCPQEERIGTCVFGFTHLRTRAYVGPPVEIQQWACETFAFGLWLDGNGELMEAINANDGRIDNIHTPGAPPPDLGGGGSGDGFCNYNQATPGGSFAVCQTQVTEQSCTADLSGTFNGFGCATDNLVGTCTLASGSAINYYEGDAASLEVGCGFQGGTWTTAGGGNGGGGGQEPEGGCTFLQSSPGGSFNVCQEPTLASACGALNGSLVLPSCDVSAIVGTCTLADNTAIHYYDGDPQGLATGCGFQGGTWTASNGGGNGGGGGQEPEGGCNFQQSSPGGTFNVCQEPTLASACGTLNGSLVLPSCDTSAIVGTCTLANNTAIHYFDGDPQGLATGCGFQGGTWQAATPPQPTVGSCEYVQSSPGGSFNVCQSDQTEQSCTGLSGTFSGNACSTTGAVGFCNTAQGQIYYYSGDPSSLSVGCGFQGGTWVTL